MVVKHGLLDKGGNTGQGYWKNRILRWIFDPKWDKNEEWRKLQNEELHGLYRSPNITKVIISWKKLNEKKMNINNSVLDYIRYKQLNWYGYVQRTDEERPPRKILRRCPPGRRRKGRPRNSGNRRLQQEWGRGELATWNGSTERGGEKIINWV